MKSDSIAIIIVNWKKYQLTQRCLNSLYEISYPNFYVILIDNESKRKDLDALSLKYPNLKIFTNDDYKLYSPIAFIIMSIIIINDKFF